MTERFPWNLWRDLDALYYDSGKAYFDSFEGFPENWETVGSEIEIHVTIRGLEVRGFIDLLVRDRNDGRLIVVDHKSKSRFRSDQELELYGFQPYLYAEWVLQTYGEYPKELAFNLFRAGTRVTIPFTEEGKAKALDWLEDTVRRIYGDEDFPDKVAVRCGERGEPIPEETYARLLLPAAVRRTAPLCQKRTLYRRRNNVRPRQYIFHFENCESFCTNPSYVAQHDHFRRHQVVCSSGAARAASFSSAAPFRLPWPQTRC